jgi:hypothetical protein
MKTDTIAVIALASFVAPVLILTPSRRSAAARQLPSEISRALVSRSTTRISVASR